MPKIADIEYTPNPNAVKCWLDKPISEGPRSFLNAHAAKDDPLAAALFAKVGATTILFNGQWFSLNKPPDAKWPAVKAGITEVLRAAP